ncbi:hypothetical protein [Nocardia bhagyanarayanae]|uniref:Uncharacterized protein n=1 Tax=Nocardia bhagyanarayanae TaxID=1215925 RepID=A0A543EXX6_9NOCA|nr:hypothetical protein [Nocardia bhagyanarayanae]TQM26453.1 hypothetical protein FB390_6650 [Nocardia bhagyanarayanae]
MAGNVGSATLIRNQVHDATVPGGPMAHPAETHSARILAERPSEWHPGMLWWDASTVVVTYPGIDGRWETRRHLVVPADGGRLAFRVPVHSAEAQQLSRDRRVIVQAGDWRGNPAIGSRQHQGTVELAYAGPLFEKVQAGLRIKYGLMRMGMANLARRFAAGATRDIVAIVTIHQHPPFRM